MAGGIWTSQNKLRPGAYINFEATNQAQPNTSTRGIVALPTTLSWGAENQIIELTADDLATGNSLAKVGFVQADESALLANLALQNATTLKLYNLYSGGTKASKTLTGGLVITAKHPGTFGNAIAILITVADTIYTVETYANGYFVDRQRVTNASELVENDFVTFGGTEVTLEATTSTLLTGGANGTVSATALATCFNTLKSTKFHTLALPSIEATDIAQTIEYARKMREDEGKYIQVVVANADNANYEGVINNVNGVTLEDGTEVTAAQFTAWVAGATAGANITASLTGKVIPNAVNIIGSLSNEEIVAGLLTGKFILSMNQNGTIKVEKDINSLHTFTSEKSYMFSKNRIMRELDEIGAAIEDIWETTYLGKVTNNDTGRTLFKSSIIDYLTDLQNKGAINEFDSASVVVAAGDDVDSVIASIAVKPLDSMEFLYMNVAISQ